jgi:hypothetical protein
MNRRVMIAFCLFLALVAGGQVFSQTRLNVKAVCYVSDAWKALPIDKDHLVLIGEEMGIQTSDRPAFNNISCHFSTVVYIEKGTAHFHGYGVYTDKDGDTMLTEFSDNSAVVNGGKGKVIGATGNFAGMEGTCDYVNEYPRAWPEGTGRLISRGNWNLSLKNPL